MMTEHKQRMVLLLAAALLLFVSSMNGQQEVLLRANPQSVDNLAARYGLTVMACVQQAPGSASIGGGAAGGSGGGKGQDKLCRMGTGGRAPADVVAALAADPMVLGAEVHPRVSLPVVVPLDPAMRAALNQGAVSALDQSTVWVLNSLFNLAPVPFFGTTVAAGYVGQPAMKLLGNDAAHAISIGSGVLIADIDNGVDANHPALLGALVPGFNFVDDDSDVSVYRGMDQSTVWVLNQGLDPAQAGVAILNQSAVTIGNRSSLSVLNSLPAAFGHGTAVAGVIRLVAPGSRILPLKSFQADGTGQLFDVLRALYYATDRGAQVINLSFSCDCTSGELVRALDYAVDRGVILAGSVGNDNALVRLFPAAYPEVLGVAATNLDDTRASFSNYGPSVFVSAPGAGIISAFPGGRYAAVWGTSFSAPMVAGQAALLLQGGLPASSVGRQIAKSSLPITLLNTTARIGRGRIDLLKSLQTR